MSDQHISIDAKAVGIGQFVQIYRALPEVTRGWQRGSLTYQNISNYMQHLNVAMLCITSNEEINLLRSHFSTVCAEYPARYQQGGQPTDSMQMLNDLLQDGHELLESPLENERLPRYLSALSTLIALPVDNTMVRFLQNAHSIISIGLRALVEAQEAAQHIGEGSYEPE